MSELNIYQASADGSVAGVSRLLHTGTSVNAQDPSGKTPLYYAVKHNKLPVVEYLMRKKADVDGKSGLNGENMCTALIAASHGGHNDIISCLLLNGALVDLSDDQNTTALHVASQKGYKAVTCLLLKNNAKVNKQNEQGETPLFLAAGNGLSEILNILIENGADVNLCDANKITPLLIAAQVGIDQHDNSKENENKFLALAVSESSPAGYLGTVKSLCKHGAEINLSDEDGLTPLLAACIMNKCDIAECLVAHGADVNACNEDGMTPLLYAAASSANLEDQDHKDMFLDIVSCLCKNGADVNITAYGVTALMGFCVGNNVDTVQCLIKHGADVHHCKDSHTVLHLCCMSGQKETTQLLIQNKAKINEQNEEKETPLWIAAANGFSELVKILIANGADVNLRDVDNRSPLFAAASAGRCIANTNQEFQENWKMANSTVDQYIETVKCLCRNGAYINLPSEDGITPLMQACIINNHAMLQCLLELEADADSFDINGRTALHIASDSGHIALVQLLIKYKPKVMKSKVGKTPLDLAQKTLQEGDAEDIENIEDFKEIITVLQRYKSNYKTDKDSKNLVPEQKTESNFIPQDILRSSVVENIVKNILKKEPKTEGILPKLFKGKEADDYLKRIWPDINNAGKEIHREKPRNDLSDTLLLKLAKEMSQDWRVIGGFLEVAHATINELSTEYKADPVYAAWTMLVRWRDSSGGSTDGKREQLRAVLLQLEREDIVDML